MKIYCQTCGSKIEFSPNDKPKFCQSCGKSLNLGSNISKSEAEAEVEELFEEEGSVSLPSIDKLDFDLEVYQMKGEKLSTIVGTSDKYKKESNPNAANNTQTKEEFLKEFQNEAGALRKERKPTEEV